MCCQLNENYTSQSLGGAYSCAQATHVVMETKDSFVVCRETEGANKTEFLLGRRSKTRDTCSQAERTTARSARVLKQSRAEQTESEKTHQW